MIRVSVIANCDDAVIFWRVAKALAGCWGFALEREQRLPDGHELGTVLENRMGFRQDDPKPGDHRPSTVWPFQRFSWTDHSVNEGDRVRYRVVPMIRSQGQLMRDLGASSHWTPWVELSGGAGDRMSVYFNRGLVISQFMARVLEEIRREKKLPSRDAALREFKKSLDEHELPIRKFLAGKLRDRMLQLLADARKRKQHVFGALYELEDDELVEALAKLGKRGHIVLANGSITKAKGEEVADARKRDQNKEARKRLRAAGLEIRDRFLSPGALGHNKFLVVADGKQEARAAWTGSTNWTKTGLCTQLNNGLLVEHAGFAQRFLDQWRRLADAGSAFPAALVAENGKRKRLKVGHGSADIWFTRTSGGEDLEALDEVVDGAKEGILFLMFMPGSKGTLATIRKRRASSKSLYVKGVVSSLPEADESAVTVTSFGDGEEHDAGLDIVQPEGIEHPFASWAASVTRNEFLFGPGKIGFAIVHSKLIVVDPFTRPVVITGSHNFSGNASSKNDENFVIVRGNGELAREYAAHVLSTYHHYRWLAHVQAQQKKKKKPPSGFLREGDGWQKYELQGAPRRELDFWVP